MFLSHFAWFLLCPIKVKGRISKRVFARNRSMPNFPKKEHFLPPDTHTYVCVSGGKKCSFFEKFAVLCLLETSVLRFALLSYYRGIGIFGWPLAYSSKNDNNFVPIQKPNQNFDKKNTFAPCVRVHLVHPWTGVPACTPDSSKNMFK